MDDNTWPTPDSVKATMRMLKEALATLETNIAAAEGKEEDEGKKFSTQVTDEVPKVIKRVQDIRSELDNTMIADVEASDEKVLRFLAQQEADYLKMKARSEKLQEYQGILKLNVDEFEVLVDRRNVVQRALVVCVCVHVCVCGGVGQCMASPAPRNESARRLAPPPSQRPPPTAATHHRTLTFDIVNQSSWCTSGHS